jgi:purine-binding chemotaxis protein CheW
MTRIPGAPAYVRGLINMRGTIVTVLDLAARLDASRGQTVEGSILLLRYRDRLVGVIVEEVLDVRTIELEEGDDTQPGSAIVRGVTALDDEPVVVLDLDVLIKQILLS